MYEYRHGGNAVFEGKRADLLDLSANINPLGFPQGVEEAIAGAIGHCTRYPDSASTDLRAKIAACEGVSAENIFCGNGASDIIFRLPLVVKPKKVMLLAPSFCDYERAVRAFGAEIALYPLEEAGGFRVDGGVARAVARERVDLLFLCNPNNPTGVLTPRGVIEEILEASQATGTTVVIDECFMDFTEEAAAHTSKPLLERYPNVVILKAFTKTFALPGIRLGYALCGDTSLTHELYACGADWAVSCLAQAAGIAALSDWQNYFERTVAFVATQRQYLKGELERLGFTVFDSRANYLFFKSPHAFDLNEELGKKGIRIRSCDNFIGLSPAHYRVAVSVRENNEKLIRAMEEVIQWQSR